MSNDGNRKWNPDTNYVKSPDSHCLDRHTGREAVKLDEDKECTVGTQIIICWVRLNPQCILFLIGCPYTKNMLYMYLWLLLYVCFPIPLQIPVHPPYFDLLPKH